MDTRDFEQALRQDGFTEIDERTLAPLQRNDSHSHPFGVRALVLEGEITLTVDGDSRPYRPGDVFTMDPGCPHAEQVGSQGVRYLVGRRR